MTAVLDRPAPVPETNTPRRAPVRIGPTLWALPPLIIVLVAALYPLIRVCLESIKLRDGGAGLGTWTSVLGSQSFRSALWRTVAIAVTSTIGCLILGTFLAIVLAFVPFPGSALVGRLIAAEITFFTPFVIRPLLAAFSLLPRAQLDAAASLGGSPLRILRSVIMPEAWPALMAGGSLVLLLTLNEFGIVLFTGAKGVITLPVLIYTRGIVTFDLPGAAVIATVQVVLSLALYIAYRAIFARLTAEKG